jgi:hypothetical protein
MRVELRSFALGLAVALALPVAACGSKKPAGLMLAITTDLTMTKDLDEVGVYVLADGRPLLTQSYAIGPGVRLPSTLAIAPPINPPSLIRVRVVGYKGGNGRILREASTTVPTERLGVLPLPLRWIDDGSALGTELDFQLNPYASARAKCPDGQTANLGACVDALVPEAKLADYDPAAIFGGGSDGAGSCFPVATCFATRTAVVVDEPTCTFTKTGAAGQADFNVAVVTNGDGDVQGSDALVALDQGSEWTVTGDVVTLPKALCTAPVRSRWKSIVVSAACGAGASAPGSVKTARFPACGAYATGSPIAP